MKESFGGIGFDPVMARLTATAIIAGVIFALAMRVLNRRTSRSKPDKAVAAVTERMGGALYAWMGACFGALMLAMLLVRQLVEAGALTWQTGLFLVALVLLAVGAQVPIVNAYRAVLRERLERDDRG